MRIVIVGAGLAGLACAEGLSGQGHDLTLIDKGRGPGGRMSTRRIATPLGEAAFDHGAQFFTVRDDAFRARVDAWIGLGCAAPWPAAGPDAYVGVPAMNAPIRQMAAALPVRWGERVTEVARHADAWRVVTDQGATLEADAVVVALPAEQAADLLAEAAPNLASRARAVPTAPCWTVMLAFTDPVSTSLDCLRGGEGAALGWAARNSAKPGRTGPEAWVLQGAPDWSRDHLEAEAPWVIEALTAEFSARLGVGLPPPLTAAAHRWRYARSGTEGAGAIWDADLRLGLCGDWLLGPRVEAAWLSGTALAGRILGQGEGALAP
jgi:predicted NAD/FAD-dependent oxidoreductase